MKLVGVFLRALPRKSLSSVCVWVVFFLVNGISPHHIKAADGKMNVVQLEKREGSGPPHPRVWFVVWGWNLPIYLWGGWASDAEGNECSLPMESGTVLFEVYDDFLAI